VKGGVNESIFGPQWKKLRVCSEADGVITCVSWLPLWSLALTVIDGQVKPRKSALLALTCFVVSVHLARGNGVCCRTYLFSRRFFQLVWGQDYDVALRALAERIRVLREEKLRLHDLRTDLEVLLATAT
jgi:hypothetical protein